MKLAVNILKISPVKARVFRTVLQLVDPLKNWQYQGRIL